jgi:hypothetical protein
MTHREVDLSIIGSENRRMTHAGIPAGRSGLTGLDRHRYR